jgi:hypothetical protein
MSDAAADTANQTFGSLATSTWRAEEACEQLLALADNFGAAYADSYQQIAAAYVHAYQTFALELDALPNKLANPLRPDWPSGISSAVPLIDPLAAVQDRSLAIRESMSEMGRKISAACVDAGEQAALAAAECHERIAATSDVELLRSIATTHADLARKLAQANVDTLRQIIA